MPEKERYDIAMEHTQHVVRWLRDDWDERFPVYHSLNEALKEFASPGLRNRTTDKAKLVMSYDEAKLLQHMFSIGSSMVSGLMDAIKEEVERIDDDARSRHDSDGD